MGAGKYRQTRRDKMAARLAADAMDVATLLAEIHAETDHRDRSRVSVGREMMRAERAYLTGQVGK